MEFIEMIGWVVMGFVPMLGGLELVNRKLGKREKIVTRTEMSRGKYPIGI